MNSPEGTKLSFTTSDGVRIVGLYHAPVGDKLTVVLLHGLGSTKEEWGSFEKVLTAQGYGYFAYDARGHGESVRTASGGRLDYKNFDRTGPGSQWSRMINDLDSVISSLSAKKKIPQEKIGLVGASLGANVALVCAATHPHTPFVVLLSPGLSYAGIETAASMRSYKDRPSLIVTSRYDINAWQSSQELCRISPRALLLQGPGGHGVQMFDGNFEKQVFQMMTQLTLPDDR